MTGIRIFHGLRSSVEKEANEWLRGFQKIEIQNVLQSLIKEDQGRGAYTEVTLTIVFRSDDHST